MWTELVGFLIFACSSVVAMQNPVDRWVEQHPGLFISICMGLLGFFIYLAVRMSEKPIAAYCCSRCKIVLEAIGIPLEIQMLQMYKQVVNIGSAEVPEEIKNDPYVYRGFFCPNCRKAFCPQCSHMQGEICPECRQRGLMPAYRPLLRNVGKTSISETQPEDQVRWYHVALGIIVPYIALPLGIGNLIMKKPKSGKIMLITSLIVMGVFFLIIWVTKNK
jgi:hypothetical protein